MPLEAVLIAVDNSEWSRNGDYAPSRFHAQSEAAGYVANAKLQENQESSVGLMTTAGSRIQVLVTPGREQGQLLNALSSIRIGGVSNVVSCLKTAQLALKNRSNKNQRQRLVLFVCSPIESPVEELVKIGKLLKKNNVALDAINFGAENMTNDNTEKLEQLVAAVNSADNSHLVSIPPGPHIFADLVLTSAIMAGSGGGAGGAAAAGGAGGAAHPGGVDPELDPEMAMAIRMSMEEERLRQQRAAGGDAQQTPATGGAAAAPQAGGAAMEDDEEALLAQAIALSMQEHNMDTGAASAAASPPASAAGAAAQPAASTSAGAGASDATAADIDMAMADPDFINSLLAGVPGAEGGVDNLLDQLNNPDANKPPSSDDKKKDDAKK